MALADFREPASRNVTVWYACERMCTLSGIVQNDVRPSKPSEREIIKRRFGSRNVRIGQEREEGWLTYDLKNL